MHSDDAADADPDLPLLRAFAAGDARSGRQLLDRHLGRLHGLAFRLLGNRADAEDVCQESFMKLWQAAPRWQPRARVSTWLYQVALNASRDRWRRMRGESTLDDEIVVEPGLGPEQRLLAEQRQRLLRHALARLPERQREALLLCHFEQLSQREAAAVLQVSEGALESLLSRARAQLREQLRQDGASDREIRS